MDYIIVDNIEEATHWLAYEDNNSIVKNQVKPNKFYELIKIKDEIFGGEEYFIKDETGTYAMHYIVHKGDYVKFKCIKEKCPYYFNSDDIIEICKINDMPLPYNETCVGFNDIEPKMERIGCKISRLIDEYDSLAKLKDYIMLENTQKKY